MTVSEKIQAWLADEGKVVSSFEFFPPKTPPKTKDGVDNLFERMDGMVAHNRASCDITWGAGGCTADRILDIANRMQNIICVESMMHLTCTNMPVDKIDHAHSIKSNGLQNVLAIPGDPPHGQDKFVLIQGGFACALDLVTLSPSLPPSLSPPLSLLPSLVESMMHLTCTNIPVDEIDHALSTIKSNGLQNVPALRCDPPHGQDKFVPIQGGFVCALDLVKHIRAQYGDYFGITVAGYPEAHPDAIGNNGVASLEAYHNYVAYLKKKVDAGVDVIVTQLFYDADIFFKFVDDCRKIGITCPIVPGIMPINNYKGFIRMTGFFKTKIPAEVSAALEPIKGNEEAVRLDGSHLVAEMCKKKEKKVSEALSGAEMEHNAGVEKKKGIDCGDGYVGPVHRQVMKIRQEIEEIEKIKHPSVHQAEMRRVLPRGSTRVRSSSPLGLTKSLN